jgi:hypothetical protein
MFLRLAVRDDEKRDFRDRHLHVDEAASGNARGAER